MLVAACGIACEVCKLLRDEACEMCGCVPGTDEKVPKKQQLILAELGFVCKVLDCASRKNWTIASSARNSPARFFIAKVNTAKAFPLAENSLKDLSRRKMALAN